MQSPHKNNLSQAVSGSPALTKANSLFDNLHFDHNRDWLSDS